MRRSIWLLAAAALAMRAEPVLLTHDAQGNLLKAVPAILRTGGLALAPREALFGARTARLIEDDGRMDEVLWISAEDADAGVVELFVGAQAAKGPDAATSLGRRVRTADHKASTQNTREAGGFGIVSKLDCGGPKDSGSRPLYDEHGLLAGWHSTRLIDGQVLAFAIPISRFDKISQTIHLTLDQWNAANDAAREAPYQRALGHLFMEDFDGALFYFRKATETEPQRGRAWYHLAFAEGKNGHGKAKLECYQKAVELEPDFAPARYYLGFSYLMGGNRDGAITEYEKLKTLDTDWAARLKLFMDAAHVDVLDKGKPGDHAHRLI